MVQIQHFKSIDFEQMVQIQHFRGGDFEQMVQNYSYIDCVWMLSMNVTVKVLIYNLIINFHLNIGTKIIFYLPGVAGWIYAPWLRRGSSPPGHRPRGLEVETPSWRPPGMMTGFRMGSRWPLTETIPETIPARTMVSPAVTASPSGSSFGPCPRMGAASVAVADPGPHPDQSRCCCRLPVGACASYWGGRVRLVRWASGMVEGYSVTRHI